MVKVRKARAGKDPIIALNADGRTIRCWYLSKSSSAGQGRESSGVPDRFTAGMLGSAPAHWEGNQKELPPPD